MSKKRLAAKAFLRGLWIALMCFGIFLWPYVAYRFYGAILRGDSISSAAQLVFGGPDLISGPIFVPTFALTGFLAPLFFLAMLWGLASWFYNSERGLYQSKLWGPLLRQTVQSLSERGVLEEKDLENPEMRRIVSEQLKGKRPDLNLNPDQIRALWKDPKFGPSLREAIETPAQTAEISGGGSR